MARRRTDRAAGTVLRAAAQLYAASRRCALAAGAAGERLGRRLREPLERGRRPWAPVARAHRRPVRDQLRQDDPRRRIPPAGRGQAHVRRPPIRVRLAVAFAGGMARVLAPPGLFLSPAPRARLDRTITRGLRSRAADVSALVQQADTGLRDAG